VVAELWIASGRDADFESFEAAASAVMGQHGGRIERRIALRGRPEANAPDEIHVATFPDRAAYQAYRDDPALLPLAELRATVIVRTVIWEGADKPPFGG
jgi:uncharacterized protein (DUF1330 family)